MEEQQKQLVGKLKDAQNVLVTVSKNPTVDQLSAAIGLTLALNKLDKHASAVFSGAVPNTIDFLKPEETLEQNTDSLRDFIIALDKSKADKLRYKVEDDVVRIFITPYKTSISEKDLEFSQGDFNVDVVVALGVHEQNDLDEAIQAHGRILHDATVASVLLDGGQDLGSINLVDAEASSLCEIMTGLIMELDDKLFDAQISTALLTGVVAMTERFSNERTTPKTMNVSSTLMSAGANQQLIATELETEHAEPAQENQGEPEQSEPPKEPGTLEIDHEQHDDGGQPTEEQGDAASDESEEEEPQEELPEPTPQIHVDEHGMLLPLEQQEHELPKITGVHATESVTEEEKGHSEVKRERMEEPPSRDSMLSANTQEESEDATTEELTLPSSDLPLLSHDNEPQEVKAKTVMPPSEADMQALLGQSEPVMPVAPAAPDTPATDHEYNHQTLAEIEQSVHSPHLEQPEMSAPAPQDTSLDDARSAVEAALSGNTQPAAPATALDMFQEAPQVTEPAPQPTVDSRIDENTLNMPLPGAQGVDQGMPPSKQQDNILPPPPPVPPPPIFGQ